ncbi:MAG: diguanylate cyclase [Halanaerobiales bacterium]|nr:diguanylate cyclase [Halanaerobiales bacterium]
MKKYITFLIFCLLLITTMVTQINAQEQDVYNEVRNVFDNHGSIILFIDQESGEILYANKAATEFYGYTQEKLTSKNIKDINMLTPKETAQEMEKASREEKNYFLFKHKIANGDIRDVKVYSYPQTYQGKKILFSIIHDVTHELALEARNQQMRRYLLFSLLLITLILLIAGIFFYKKNIKIKKHKDKLENLNKLRQTYIDADDSMIYLKDHDLKYIFVNNSTANFYGMKKEEFIGKDDYDLSNREFAKLKESTDQKVLENIELIEDEVRWKNNIYKTTKFPVKLPDGNYGVGAYIKNITEDYMLKRKLSIEKNKYLQTLISIGDGVIVVDLDKNIEMINKQAEDLTGWSYEKAVGKNYKEVLKLRDENGKSLENDIVEEVLQNNEIYSLKEKTLLTSKDGVNFYIDDSVAPIKDNEGQIFGAVIVFRDDTLNQNQKEKIKYISYHDHLTGLYNRRFFEEELNRLNTIRQVPISIIMADVNGLKFINDTYGHQRGDQILKRAANLMSSVLRDEDIIARFGGDEFSIILPQNSSNQAKKVVGRIREATKEYKDDQIPISLGIGYATKTSDEQDIEKTFSKADDKMYKDKLTKIKSATNKLVKNLLTTLSTKSNESKNHAVRMTKLAAKLGEKMSLNEEMLNNLSLLATLHDIGKVNILENILKKPGKLTKKEWNLIKEHPEKGFIIANSTDEFAPIAKYILYHHERWNGKGYPEGIKGKEIPLLSRIISIVDAYDVMTHNRPYSKVISKEKALKEIKEHAGSQFDPEISEIFIELIKEENNL